MQTKKIEVRCIKCQKKISINKLVFQNPLYSSYVILYVNRKLGLQDNNKYRSIIGTKILVGNYPSKQYHRSFTNHLKFFLRFKA